MRPVVTEPGHDEGVSELLEHVLAVFKHFWPRRSRALCSCGYGTRPAEATDGEIQEEVARQLLITEHGARERYPGETVEVPYASANGPASAAP